MTPDIQSRIAILRQKCIDGTVTKEELIEALREMAQGRLAAVKASAASKKKAARAEVKPANEMLDELSELL